MIEFKHIKRLGDLSTPTPTPARPPALHWYWGDWQVERKDGKHAPPRGELVPIRWQEIAAMTIRQDARKICGSVFARREKPPQKAKPRKRQIALLQKTIDLL